MRLYRETCAISDPRTGFLGNILRFVGRGRIPLVRRAPTTSIEVAGARPRDPRRPCRRRGEKICHKPLQEIAHPTAIPRERRHGSIPGDTLGRLTRSASEGNPGPRLRFLMLRCISFARKGPDKTAPGNARGGG